MAITPYQSAGVKAWNVLARAMPGRVMSPTLSLDALMQAAKKTVGGGDFANTTFVEPLRRLLEAIEATADLHPFGRFYVKQVITGLLVNRLKLEDLWARHGEIFNEPIRQPIIILGMPRTGSSFLFNLFAQVPSHRFLTNWEATVSQVPPAGTYTFE